MFRERDEDSGTVRTNSRQAKADDEAGPAGLARGGTSPSYPVGDAHEEVQSPRSDMPARMKSLHRRAHA